MSTLIIPEQQQQEELFNAEELPVGRELLSLDEDERRGNFSGKIISRNREKYGRIVAALAEGLGIRQISRAFGVSPHTVQGIREREGDSIATVKEELGRRFTRISRVAAERIEEELDRNPNIPLRELSVCLGIIEDKRALVSGAPTAITGHIHVDANAVAAELKAQLEAGMVHGEVNAGGAGTEEVDNAG